MKGNIWLLSVLILGLSAIGGVFIFFSDAVREYYFKSFKEGINKTGYLATWIAKYPNLWFFKAFGFLIWIFVALIIILVFWKRQ